MDTGQVSEAPDGDPATAPRHASSSRALRGQGDGSREKLIGLIGGLSPYQIGIIGALILMTFAFVNGYGTLFNDTRSYVRGGAMVAKIIAKKDLAPQWRSRADVDLNPNREVRESTVSIPQVGQAPRKEQTYVNGNRSVYYGVLAFLGYITGNFWLTIFSQALSISIPLALVMRRGLDLDGYIYLAVIGCLAVLTTAGPFVAWIMPDIFAGVVILCLAACAAFWHKFKIVDRVVMFGLIAFSTLAHPSLLVVVGALTVCMLAWGLYRRDEDKILKTAGVAASALVIAVAGSFAVSKASERISGEKPIMMPFVTAHLIDMGPGYRYLKSNCGHAQFAVCEYLPRLPMSWIVFLGGSDQGVFNNADNATKRRLTAEQGHFALDVFRFDPVGVTLGLAKDGISELGLFSLNDMVVDNLALSNIRQTFPDNVTRGIERSLIVRNPWVLQALSIIDYAAVILSVGILAYFLSMKKRMGLLNPFSTPGLSTLTIVVTLGVVLNGLAVGVIASPLDRYQARVVWLIPMAAALAVVLALRARCGRSPLEPLG